MPVRGKVPAVNDEVRPLRWREAWPWLLLCVIIAAVFGWPGPELMS